MKIMASDPITSWEIDGETVADFTFLGSKITADGDCSHEIKRHSLEGKLRPTSIAYSKAETLLCQQRSDGRVHWPGGGDHHRGGKGATEREAPVVGVTSRQRDELPISFFSYILWASGLASLVPTSELNNFGPCGQVSFGPHSLCSLEPCHLVSLNPAA